MSQNLEAGTYSLEAYGAATHRSQRATFTVVNAAPTPVPPAPTFAPPTPVKLVGTPLIAVNPPVVVPGAQTVVSGSGFQPGEVVLIRINGALQGNVSADSFGNFGGVILTIPVGAAPGGYVVAATGATSGVTTSVGLTVQAVQPKPSASISLSPSSTLAGGQVTVAGTGFAAGESVIVSLNGAIVQSITTDGSGSFRNGSFFVPANLGAGRYAVSAVGASSGRGTSAALTVNPVPAVDGGSLLPQSRHGDAWCAYRLRWQRLRREGDGADPSGWHPSPGGGCRSQRRLRRLIPG